MSKKTVCKIRAPQRTVLSLSFFTLYNTDISYWTESCYLNKSSNDLAIVRCISKGEESEYRASVEKFVTWRKTKDVVEG